MKRCLTLTAAVAAATLACAETFFWNGDTGNKEYTNAVVGRVYACWTNETHTTAVGPTNGNTYVIACGSGAPQTQATTTQYFPGAELHIGELGSAVSPTLMTRTTGYVNRWSRKQDYPFMVVTNLYWYRGTLKCNTGLSIDSKTGRLDEEKARRHATGFSGQLHVINTGVTPEQHHICPNVADKNGPRNTCLASDLVGEADVEITCKGDKSENGVEQRLGGVRLYLMGDNSRYKGTFRAWNWHTVSLISDTALGDPSTPNPAALLLGTNGGLEVSHLANLGTTRGVTLMEGATGAFVTTFSTETVTIRLPIAGKGIPFRSIGEGTVVYAGDYSAGDWTVEKGTLVVASEATFPANQKFIVKAGATLRFSSARSGVTIAAEPGAKVLYDAIAYDNTTGVAVPLDYTTCDAPEQPYIVRLTERIDRAEDVRLEVARFAPDAVLDVAGFVIDPDSVVSPLFASFELVDGSEAKSLYLCVAAHPDVIQFTREAATNKTNHALVDQIVKGVYTWSDHLVPQAGKHYMITNGAPGTTASGWHSECAFNGETLSIIAPGSIYTRDKCATFKRVYFGPGTRCDGRGCGYGDLPHWLFGEFTIGGTASKPVCFASRWGAGENGGKLDYAKNSIGIGGQLKGFGYLKFDGNALADIRIDSTNADFFGCLDLAATGNSVTNHGYAFRHPYALGGPLVASQTNFDALVVRAFWGNLKPLETMTLSTPGRGITFVGGTAGFDIPAGVTFTVAEPIRSVNGICKHGQGTLAFSGPIAFGRDGTAADDGGNSCIQVYAGGIKPMNGTTLAGTKFFVRQAMTIVIDPNATDEMVRTYGLFNQKPTSFMFDDGATLTAEIEGAADSTRADLTIAVPICTVSNKGDELNSNQAADRVRAKLRLAKAWRGYKTRLVEDVPADYPNMVRFTAVCEKQGLYLIVK